MRLIGGLARVTETTAGGRVYTLRLSAGREGGVVSRCWAPAGSDHTLHSAESSAATRPHVTSCTIPSNPWLSEQERGSNRSVGARQGTRRTSAYFGPRNIRFQRIRSGSVATLR